MLKNSMRVFALLLVAIALLSCTCFCFAAESGGTIKVSYLMDETPVSDSTIYLYKIADESNFVFTYTEQFSKYFLTLDLSDEETMKALPTTLQSYIQRDNLKAGFEAVTDESGTCSFKDMENGIYLLTGKTWYRGDWTYRIVPALVSIPYTDVNSELKYNPEISLKHDATYYSPVIPEKKTVDVTVTKTWRADNASVIPEKVSVSLLADGKIYETVDLTAAENWIHTWEKLTADSDYTVVENNVPEGFECNIRRDGNNWEITNTYTAKEEPSPTPSPEITPSPDVTPTPTPVPTLIPTPAPKPTTTPEPSKPKLPQTGQLQWPVAAAAAAAAMFCLIGIIAALPAVRKRADGDEKRELRLQWITLISVIIAFACIFAAIGLTSYNAVQDERAGDEIARTLEVLNIPDAPKKDPLDEFTGLFMTPEEEEWGEVTQEVNGHTYLGELYIPGLSLTLPVSADWSELEAKTAPCRWEGNVHDNNMIIAGHNYNSHFGKLKYLQEGDAVYFTDMSGNVHTYEVVKLETIGGYEVDEMRAGSDTDWDLTLFTCTYGGASRVTVRCARAGSVSAGSEES